MKMKRNPISNAIYKALFTGFVASSALGTVAIAQSDQDQTVEEQGKITVTGSRIKRSDVEGALPVTVITREQIELSGDSSAADFIRNLTFNSTGSYRPQSGSSAQGTASVSLRGLGSSRTLVLIDGRRMPMSPSTGADQDLNAIPAGAIERIEILTDGASAIYGSDAIGGVVNVILRSDYEGVEIMLGGSEPSIPRHGGEVEEGSIIFGTASDRSRLVAGVSWNSKEITYNRDHPWTGKGVTPYSNNMESIDRRADGSYDLNLQAIPGACNFPGKAFYLSQNAAGQDLCQFDHLSVSAEEASTANKSMYTKGSYDVNDNWQVWMNVSIAETKSFGRYAPVPDYVYMDATSPNNPTNPNSPHYAPELGVIQQDILIYHRYDALGNRDGETTNRLSNFMAGTTGTIGNAEIEFGVSRANNSSSDIGRNYLLRSAARQAINDGSYDIFNPYGNSEEVLNGMKVVISRMSKYDQEQIFGSVAFDLFDMSAGAVSLFIGAETTKVKYADLYDSLSEAGQIGGSAGNSARGNRTVDSIFFEALVPIMSNLEMSLAGRYDDYSDYGSDFSPKISFRFQPLDNLTLRASYGEGFHAPSLPILTQKESFSAESVNDARSCEALGAAPTCSLQVDTFFIANPDLQSETSKQYSLGLAYEPVDWMNFTLDYYNIAIDNRIRSFGAQWLINAAETGDPIPAGLGVVRKPSGALDEITAGYGNEGKVNNRGLDLNVRFNYDFLGGNVSNTLAVSKILHLSTDGGRDVTKAPGVPDTRAALNNLYSYGDWSFAWNVNMIGSQYNRETGNADGSVNRLGHVPTWVTHDVQLNYHAPWNGKITLGAQNVFEKYPPLGLGDTAGRAYDFYLYNGFGRVSYLRYTQTF